MAIVELSVVPLGTKTPSVSQYVARAIKVLEKEKDIKYEITAMGTIIEGDLDRILAVVRKMHEGTFGDGVARVLTTVKIDDRRDKAQPFRRDYGVVFRRADELEAAQKPEGPLGHRLCCHRRIRFDRELAEDPCSEANLAFVRRNPEP